VIATPVGAIPEIIHHGENGWIVEVDDLEDLENSIIELLGNSDLRTRLGQAGRQSVEQHYSIATVTSQLIDLYRLVAGKRRTSTAGKALRRF
jgi:glycosyltransferase involved in cell wall biosynthesis